jgi:hypothetical protein
MVAVLVSFTILLSVVLGSLALISNSTKHSRHQQDTDLALAAAKAGLNDLLTMLRGDPSYLDGITGPKDAYCSDDPEFGNPATGGPDGDHFMDRCGWGPGTKVGWQDMAGGRQAFHYKVEAYSPITEDATVLVTGRAGAVFRALRGYLGRQSTEQWLYFSDYELADPNDYTTYTTWVDDPAESVYGPNQLTSEGCGGNYAVTADATQLPQLGYKWQMGPGSKITRTYQKKGLTYPCAEPDFVGDTLLGPVHSNDTIRATNTVFGGTFSTADAACAGAQDGNDCVNGAGNSFASPPVLQSAPLALPSTDDPREAAVADGRGCLYQGPTRIVLDGAEMRVWSKHTTVSRPGCGILAELNSPDGALVEIPREGDEALVYVDQLPPGEAAAKGLTDDPIRSGEIGDGLPLGTYSGSKVAAVPGASYTYEKAMRLPSKGNTKGNLYIEGAFDSSLTVAAFGLVVVTGDLVAVDPANDLLGIISGSSIEVFNPVMETYTAQTVPDPTTGEFTWKVPRTIGLDGSWPEYHNLYDSDARTFTIQAALYASTAGFGVQNWREGGDLGTLHVFGSIAQRFRGVVGYHDDLTGQLYSGYRKQYVYNESLSKNSPLLFSPISNGAWVITWLEQAAPPAQIAK